MTASNDRYRTGFRRKDKAELDDLFDAGSNTPPTGSQRAERSCAKAALAHKRASGVSVVILGNGSEAASLCAALRLLGIEAAMAGGLKEVVALTQSETARLVVADESLVDGLTASRQLRLHKTLTIMLFGSLHDKDGWQRALEVEADYYFRKSMGMSEQVARVRAILRRG